MMELLTRNQVQKFFQDGNEVLTFSENEKKDRYSYQENSLKDLFYLGD